jgi:hypothetical protein
MPEVQKGQTKDEYISYCISWIKKNEPDKADWETGHLYKHCEGLWNNRNKEASSDMKERKDVAESLQNIGYKPIALTSTAIGIGKIFEGTIVMSDMTEEIKTDGERITKYIIVDAIAAVGDRFYGNLFVPSSTLRASAHLWDSTYNDISHLGTMYPAGMSSVENLEYITGYNSDSSFDNSINAVRVKMHINKDSPKYNVWKNFMDINKDAKRIPNVSIFGFYRSEAMKRKELPSGIYIPDDVKHGEYVVAMTDIIPFAITTCLKGKCDDKAGCGISTGFKEDGTPCDCTNNLCIPPIKEIEIDTKKLEYLKNRIKNIGK